MAPFDYVLGAEAHRAVVQLRFREREKLADVFEHIARHPATKGDFVEYDSVGRPHEVKLVDDFLITFRADHAAGEIRIVRVEKVP